MSRSLPVAVAGALLGFGGWVWLTGPGTSVPNALLALLCAILCGRAAWWLVARNLTEEAGTPEGESAPPHHAGRRAPPVDAEARRRPTE